LYYLRRKTLQPRMLLKICKIWPMHLGLKEVLQKNSMHKQF
jgi:hypothetical protein